MVKVETLGRHKNFTELIYTRNDVKVDNFQSQFWNCSRTKMYKKKLQNLPDSSIPVGVSPLIYFPYFSSLF